jgi:hypothetical protein
MKGVSLLKKAAVIIVTILLALHCLPGTMRAQQPDWNVEIIQGPEVAEIIFKVINNTPGEMVLEFPSSQFFDYEVSDQSGNKVYRYSENKAFLQAIQKVRVKSGGNKVWRDKWKYTSSEGKRIPAGTYTIKASLMIKKINGELVKNDFVKTLEIKAEAENPSFKNVDFIKSDGSYKVKGEANVSAGCFYYTVEDGHTILKEEALVKVNKEYPNWTSFDFDFELAAEKLPENRPVLLNLYERDLNEGTIYHNYTVRLN